MGSYVAEPSKEARCWHMWKALRPIIAAVARCGWLDEAEKFAKLPVNDCKNFDTIAEYKKTAEENAKDWKRWGLNEN